jgi:hypothetical protein
MGSAIRATRKNVEERREEHFGINPAAMLP